MELIVFWTVLVVFLAVYFWFRRPDPRLPPSPLRPLPIVGHLFHVARDSRPQFRNWRERCGDIYSLYMGGSLVVVLNGYDLIKEALVKKADACSDRPPFFVDQVSGLSGKGITFASGKIWKEQRMVTLSILREFGMGKNILADTIQDEVGFYLNYLASMTNLVSDIHLATNISTCNIICSILIGRRFEHSDGKFRSLMQKLIALNAGHHNVSWVNFIPWLSRLPGDPFMAKEMISIVQDLSHLIVEFVEEKQQAVKDTTKIYNLIDAYTAERSKKLNAGKDCFLDDANLTKVVMDLFRAGTQTSSTTITWCILYLLNYPTVQEKVYREIKEKVGVNRFPNIQDKPQLPYLNAVIMETQRLASIAPLSVTHMCSETVTLRGYSLPKGTYVIPNLDSVLHDKATWGHDVMVFNPDRFLDVSGNLVKPEEFIPFGLGRRACLGHSIANMELFLFLSSMIQRFRFLPPLSGSVPPMNYECGIIISPKPFQMRLEEREISN